MSNTVVVITGAAPLDRRDCRHARRCRAHRRRRWARSCARRRVGAVGARRRPRLGVGERPGVGVEHTTIVRHPVDKPATDTELAVAHAASLAPERILLVAGVGDRLDHAVAALGALGAAAVAGVDRLEAWWGSDQFVVIHGPGSTTLDLPIGTTFSVLATHGVAEGVTVQGRAGRCRTIASSRSSASASATRSSSHLWRCPSSPA